MPPRHRLWGLWVLLLLLVPAAMWAVDWRPNEMPDPAPSWPGWQADRLLDDEYYRAIDGWLGESTPARDVGLWARYEVDYGLLGDSPSDQVAVGDDGWLFSRSFVDTPCDALAAIGAPVVDADRDAGFTWIVALSKAYWLEELLEPHDRPPPCSGEERDGIRRRLDADPRGFDVNAAIDPDPAGSFYPRDPHWSPAGRMAVAEALVEHFAPGIWDDEALVADDDTLLQGMTRFMGSNDTDSFPDARVERDVTFTVEEQSFGLGLLVWQRSTATGGPVIPGTTYMFGDSQGASIVPYIESYFEELIFVGWLRTQLGPLPLGLPDPDRVIVEAIDQWAADTFTNPVIAEVAAQLPLDQP